jgi:ketosteroid isomerase-like protein
MKKLVFIIFLTLSGCGSKFDRVPEEKAIRELLNAQEIAWNAGNIDEFMEGYWKSDSLMFIGSNITQGWNATIERYRKSYPDRDAMGQLKFTFYDFKFVDDTSCLVTGKYQLTRKADEPSGMFTLLLKKIDGSWRIIYDHTS